MPSRLARFYTSEYERDTVRYFRSTLSEGDVFFDIGAHLGLFTVLGANLVGSSGTVACFEPTLATQKALREIVNLNRVQNNVKIFGIAVSSRRGTATFYDAGDKLSVTNSLVRNETSERTIEVPTISLDEFVSDHGLKPNCIKIDVEGAELDVLRGAADTLENVRPKVRLAIHPPFHHNSLQTCTEIWSILKERRYSINFKGMPLEKDWFCSQRDFIDVNAAPDK